MQMLRKPTAMKGRTYVVNLVAVHHQQRAYKARHRLLAEPAGGASPRLPSIANKVQAIEPNTPGNPNTSVPHIMDTAGSSQTPPQTSATDTAPKNDCIYQDLITDEDFGSDDLPDDDKSASPRLPSEQKTKSTNQAQNRWLQPPTKNQHPKVCLNQGHKIGCAAMLGIFCSARQVMPQELVASAEHQRFLD